jgi:enediyne biosynthesis protein E4
MRRRHRILVLALLVVTGLAWCTWTLLASGRHRVAMAEIAAEMAAGRYAIAARNLSELIAQNPNDDEAVYQLGACEQARGRNQAAADAWVRVTPGSSFSARAISARMSLYLDSGRLAAAEQLMDHAAQDPRNDRTGLRILLLPTFSQQGRLEDAQRLVVQRWEHLRETGEETSELAINLARLHAELQWTPIPIEAARANLDQAARLAPDDDRVWLGQANLAMRTGNHGEAERLLIACLKRRPDDVPVWRARLSWGRAAGRVDIVREAMTHLPAGESAPAEVNRIAAWLAANHGELAAERQALDRLIIAEPADLAALRRLVELARQDGHPDRAAEFERRLAEIDRQTTRYLKLHGRNQPIRDAAEMGQLAERLGRSFEARVFLGLAAAESLNRDDAKRSLQSLR